MLWVIVFMVSAPRIDLRGKNVLNERFIAFGIYCRNFAVLVNNDNHFATATTLPLGVK
jgi:hypothetical protein